MEEVAYKASAIMVDSCFRYINLINFSFYSQDVFLLNACFSYRQYTTKKVLSSSFSSSSERVIYYSSNPQH